MRNGVVVESERTKENTKGNKGMTEAEKIEMFLSIQADIKAEKSTDEILAKWLPIFRWFDNILSVYTTYEKLDFEIIYQGTKVYSAFNNSVYTIEDDFAFTVLKILSDNNKLGEIDTMSKKYQVMRVRTDTTHTIAITKEIFAELVQSSEVNPSSFVDTLQEIMGFYATNWLLSRLRQHNLQLDGRTIDFKLQDNIRIICTID